MLRKILNNDFFRSIMTLSSGTILGQIIALLFSPVMTRLFSPEDIGTYTIVITAVNMFGGVLVGRYDLSIITEKDEDNVNALVKFCIRLSVLSSVTLSILYTLYSYGNGEMLWSKWVFLLTIFILLLTQSLTLIVTSYNNRLDRYNLISKGSVFQAASREGSMTLFGLVNANSFLLTFSQIIGRILNLLVQSKYFFKNYVNILSADKILEKKMAIKYRNQVMYSTPALFANSFSYSSINIFVSQLFGSSILGFYSLSYRLLGFPLTLVSSNVSTVYFREASKEYNSTGGYRRRFLQTSIFLVMIAIFMVLFLELFSPYLFSLVFGTEWAIAGRYVQILAPMFAFRLIVTSLSTGLIISKKQNYELLMQISFIVVSIAIFIVTKNIGLAIEKYLMLISISYSFIYILYYILLYKMSGEKN